MRTTIEVKDLSNAQWKWLQDVIGNGLVPGDPKVCVTFSQGGEEAWHGEMAVRAFASVLSILRAMEIPAEAKTWAGAYPECEHGLFSGCDKCTRALPSRCPHQHVGGVCTWCGHSQPESELPLCGEKWCCYEHRRADVACPAAYATDQDDMNTRPAGADQ